MDHFIGGKLSIGTPNPAQSVASWFEPRGIVALLTMRVQDLILRSRALRGVSKDGAIEIALLPHRIGADHHLGITLRAIGGQIRRDGAGVIEPDHRAARRFRDHVVVDQRRAGAGVTDGGG
jgi:hypothetical protein